MPGKKAQVTVFIIIGIVILVGAFFAVWLMGNKDTGIISQGHADDVRMFVEGCIAGDVEEAAGLMAAQGGHLILPKLVFEYDGHITSYGIYENNNTLISKATLENQLARYVELSLVRCVGNFSQFPGKDIIAKEPIAVTGLTDDFIVVEVEYPLWVDGQIMDKFSVTVPSPLGRFYRTARFAVAKQLQDVDWIDTAYLAGLDEPIEIIPVTEDEMLVVIGDEVRFVFAEKLILNRKPQIIMQDSFVLRDSTPWLYKVVCTDPDGDPVTISDDTSMLDTLADGSILTTPEIPGDFNVTFTCSDDHYNYVQKKVLIRVVG